MSDTLFGRLPNGSEVMLITLSNSQGMQVEFINYGAAIHRIKTPDSNGTLGDVTLFCTELDHYLKQDAYLGATIGRFANRINKARCTINGQKIELTANEGENILHGGPNGFNSRLWSYSYGSNENGSWLRFSLISHDGSQGFPGELQTQVEYLLDNCNTLHVTMTAQTNKPTIVSMTNHTYFNLSGKQNSDLSAHYFQILSDTYLDIDSQGIPTGNIQSVENSVFDLRHPREISHTLEPLADVLQPTRGYDHNYIFNDGPELLRKAQVTHADSGRILSLSSNHPGAQFYTGNYLQDCNVIGPNGARYKNHSGFCIEPQQFPDSPNHPHFPDCSLNPGDTYNHKIEYHFSTIDIEDVMNMSWYLKN